MIGGLLKSTSSAALFAALGLFAMSGGVTPAKAADLGGDCCADLEERVAELEATVARKGNRRMSLTISGGVNTAVMAWDAGDAYGAVAGAKGVPPTVTTTTTVGPATGLQNIVPGTGDGGQVVGAGDPGHIDPPHVHLQHGHNATSTSTFTKGTDPVAGRRAGNSRDVYIVDQVAGTGFVLNGSANINPNLSAGFNLTFGINSQARSLTVNQFDDDAPDALGSSDATIVMNLAHWYLDHKQIGRLTVGRANTATAGITGIDLGGAGVVANVNIGWWNGGFFTDNAGTKWGDLLGGGTVNGSTTSRGNIISYTSPTLSGFQAAAAWGENDVWDVALRYAGEFSGFRLAAGIGYIDNGSGTNEVVADIPANNGIDTPSQWRGSASILHVASGLYLSGAYLVQNNDRVTAGANDDTTLLYVNGGIAKNWTGLGNTVLYGEYAQVEDAIKTANTVNAVTGDLTAVTGTNLGNAEVWGLGVVQHVDAAAMELYLAYRNYSADAAATDFDVVMGGARVKF